MRRAAAAGRAAALVVAWLLAACGSAPPSVPSAPDEVPAPAPRSADPVSTFEIAQRERVAMLEKQGRLADAQVALESLVLVRPDAHRAELAELKRKIDAAVNDRLQRARAALKKGELDVAEQWFLGVLALQPDQAEAIDGLRGIDRTRVRRDYLSRPPRIAFARRPAQPTTPAAVAKSEVAAGDALELEHVAMLASQGELDDAIAVMERRLAANTNDPAARRLMANLLFKKAQALRATDRAGASAALTRCLQLDPNHAAAKTLMRQLAAAPGNSAATANSPAPNANGARPTPQPPPAAAR